jgi:hypothetical protein
MTKGPPDDPAVGPTPTGIVNGSHNHIIYSEEEVPGEWGTYASASEIGGDEHHTNIKGVYCQFAFSVTGITWIGE